MKIESQPYPADPQITLLALSGRLDTASEAVVAPQVLQAIEECGTGIIFDLAQVDFVSSAGLRLLVQAFKKTGTQGKKLAMVQTQPAVYKIFKLAALEEVFNLYQDSASAVEAVWKKS